MTSETSSGRKIGEAEGSNSKVKRSVGKESSGMGSPGLRRSARETLGRRSVSVTPVKNGGSPIQPGIRKSERLEKMTPEAATAAPRRIERVEKPNITTQLRRPERGENQPSPDQNDKTDKGSTLANGKGKKENMKRRGSGDMFSKRMRLDAKRFKALFVEKNKKSDSSEPSGEPKLQEKVPQVDFYATSSRVFENEELSARRENTAREISEDPVKETDLLERSTPEIQRNEELSSIKEDKIEEPESLKREASGEPKLQEKVPQVVYYATDSRVFEDVNHSTSPSENTARKISEDPAKGPDLLERFTPEGQPRDELSSINKEKHEEPETSKRLEIRFKKLSCDINEKEPTEHDDLSGRSASSPKRRFVHFWVPAPLSNVQLEQYCATILSNSISLRSSSKSDPVGAFRDLLISLCKTCSHPFLVDLDLHHTLYKGLKATEFLDAGVKASGKMQFLDEMLFQIKKQDLRVLILYESVSMARDSNGDFLEDYMCQRHGPDSFERVEPGVSSKIKQASLDTFNDKQSGRFVFLLETRACLPSIKLSSVDFVIIYNSDWNPENDIRALQKIVLDSQQDHMKVFRLFVPQTVEENIMILAKQNITLDSNINFINRSNRDKLLIRGASSLFEKLDRFHRVDAPVFTVISSVDSAFLKDVVRELMNILQNGTNMENDLPVSLKVAESNATHGKFLLVPDKLNTTLEENFPQDFWSKLLEGRSPRWKYVSCSKQRSRRRVHHIESEDVQHNTNEEAARKRRKVANDSTYVTSKIIVENKKVTVGTGSTSSKILSYSSRPSNKNVDARVAHIPSAFQNNSTGGSGNLLEENKNLRHSHKSLHLRLKPDILQLCEHLHLPEVAKSMAERFLEYIMENHQVKGAPEMLLQAFQLSVCRIAASLVRQKINGKESLALAKQHLNFCCSYEDMEYEYLKMGILKELFIQSAMKDEVTALADKNEVPVKDTSEDSGGPNQVSPGSQGVALGKAPKIPNRERMMLKIIKKIKNKCRKRMAILTQKQCVETDELHKNKDKQKTQLEQQRKVDIAAVRKIFGASPYMIDKLKAKEEEYSKKLEEHEVNFDARLRSLKDMHLSAKEKEKKLESYWLENVVDEVIHKLPQMDPAISKSNSKSIDFDLGDSNKGRSNQDVIKNIPGIPSGDAVQSEKRDGPSVVSSCADSLLRKNVDHAISTPAKLQHLDSNIADGSLSPLDQVSKSIDSTVQMEIAQSSSDDTLNVRPSGEETLVDPVVSPQLSPLAELIPDSVLLLNAPTVHVPQSVSVSILLSDSRESEVLLGERVQFPKPPVEEVDNASAVEPPSLQSANCMPSHQLNTESLGTEGQPELPSCSLEQPDSDARLNPQLLRTTTHCCNVERPAAETARLLPTSRLFVSSSRQPNSDVQITEGTGSTPNANDPNNFSDNTMSFPCILPANIPVSRATSLPGIRGTPAMADSANGLVHSPTIGSTVGAYTPTPSYMDPLKSELERIEKEAEYVIKHYGDMKQQLNSESEKEIEEMVTQIRKKFEMKTMELESAFACKKNELDACHKKTYMNWMLADAFIKKCMPTQQDGQQQQPRLPHESAQRPSLMPSMSSASQTSGRLHPTDSVMHPICANASGPSPAFPSSGTPIPISRNEPSARTLGSLHANQNSSRPDGTIGTCTTTPLARSTFATTQPIGTCTTTPLPSSTFATTPPNGTIGTCTTTPLASTTFATTPPSVQANLPLSNGTVGISTMTPLARFPFSTPPSVQANQNPLRPHGTISTCTMASVPRSTFASTTPISGLPVTRPYLASPLRTSMGISPIIEVTMPRPVQFVSHSSALFCGNSTLRPISTISSTPPTSKMDSLSESQAPPHLRSTIRPVHPSSHRQHPNVPPATASIATNRPTMDNRDSLSPSTSGGTSDVPIAFLTARQVRDNENRLRIDTTDTAVTLSPPQIDRPLPERPQSAPPSIPTPVCDGITHRTPIGSVSPAVELVYLSDDD